MTFFGFLGPLKGTFSPYFFWYSSYLIFVNRTSRTKLGILINGLITELWLSKDGPKLCLLRHVKFWIFRPPQELISNYFFMILLALIICHKINKCAKLYHDQISIGGVMVAKISLKKSIFPIFGTYPYFKFLPWLQILSIRFLRCISAHKHQIARYLELLKCRERFVLTQYFPPF